MLKAWKKRREKKRERKKTALALSFPRKVNFIANDLVHMINMHNLELADSYLMTDIEEESTEDMRVAMIKDMQKHTNKNRRGAKKFARKAHRYGMTSEEFRLLLAMNDMKVRTKIMKSAEEDDKKDKGHETVPLAKKTAKKEQSTALPQPTTQGILSGTVLLPQIEEAASSDETSSDG